MTTIINEYGLIILILTVVAIASVLAQKLTIGAAITGWIIGFLVFKGGGLAGVIMMAAFFIMGTAATSFKIAVKQQLGLAESNKGRRTAGQVMANAAVAAILGLLAVLYKENAALYQIMIAASLASATADTLSSEIGNIYGKKFYNITTFKKDLRGLNGVISTEGTLTGIIGSAVIAFIYAASYGWNKNIAVIVIAGTLGNFTDSLLGATLERKHYLTNNLVNFINTLVAALLAVLMFWL